MRNPLLLASALLLTFAAPVLGGEFRWESDLEAAEARAHKEQKPLLVVFRCLP